MADSSLSTASGITANDIAGQDANEHQYAVLQCDGERTGLFSMIVLPWPAPLLIPVEAYPNRWPAWFQPTLVTMQTLLAGPFPASFGQASLEHFWASPSHDEVNTRLYKRCQCF
jgi:hypothetical protein